MVGIAAAGNEPCFLSVGAASKGPSLMNGLARVGYSASGLGVRESMARTRMLGKIGEAAVGDIGPKIRITINGRDRIVDGLNDIALSEIKNVKKLSYTRQLRDFTDYSLQKGFQFNLYILSPKTYLSIPLKNAINSGKIKVKYIF